MKVPLLLLLTCLACKKPMPTQSQLFVSYLRDSLKTSSDNGIYLIVPCAGCIGCNEHVFSEIQKKMIDPSTTIVICSNNSKFNIFTETNKIVYDRYGFMSHYTFGTGYPAYISLFNNKITSTRCITPESVLNP